MTGTEAEVLISRLVALRGMPDSAEPYAEVLGHLPAEDIDRGVSRALKQRIWFPTPAELLQDCLDAKPRVTWRGGYGSSPVAVGTITLPDGRSLTVSGREWAYDCGDCTDSGWREIPRDTLGQARVERCACWASNPTLRRRREAQAQQVTTRTKGRGDE